MKFSLINGIVASARGADAMHESHSLGCKPPQSMQLAQVQQATELLVLVPRHGCRALVSPDTASLALIASHDSSFLPSCPAEGPCPCIPSLQCLWTVNTTLPIFRGPHGTGTLISCSCQRSYLLSLPKPAKNSIHGPGCIPLWAAHAVKQLQTNIAGT